MCVFFVIFVMVSWFLKKGFILGIKVWKGIIEGALLTAVWFSIGRETSIRPKKRCLFPVTLPLQVFIQKNPYPKVFSALPTPNQRKTCIKHTFLTKKYFTDLPTLFFFRLLQETNNFFFRPYTSPSIYEYLELHNKKLWRILLVSNIDIWRICLASDTDFSMRKKNKKKSLCQ